jgi:hypothetical protein
MQTRPPLQREVRFSESKVDPEDFLVWAELQRLLNQIDGLGNGMIGRIGIRAGIPRRLFFQTVGTEDPR